MAMDTVKDQIEVVAAMKGAAAALKTEVKKINLDSVEVFCGCYCCFFCFQSVVLILKIAPFKDTMDDMAELMEEMGEITEMLGQSYG
jgi:hypothetical protein